MKEIQLNEYKQIELEILKELHAFCEKNNIRYYLAYGTLIGAVRHNGFIPWDDDIDVWMPREDYNRFIKLYSQTNTNYSIISFPKNQNCWLAWAKMFDNRTRIIENGTRGVDDCGLYIDIFPIDGAGNSEKESAKVNKQNKRAFTIIYGNIQKIKIVNLKTFLARLFCSVSSWKRTLRRMILRLESNNMWKTKYCVVAIPMAGYKQVFETRMFEKAIKCKFENEEFWIPACYDEVLRMIYGDYMTLPPESERVPHHNLSAFWINN